MQAILALTLEVSGVKCLDSVLLSEGEHYPANKIEQTEKALVVCDSPGPKALLCLNELVRTLWVHRNGKLESGLRAGVKLLVNQVKS
jgi:hypothetical protein